MFGFKGLSGSGGGFSEIVAVDTEMCYALPDGRDLSLAALIEPLAVACHAVAIWGISNWLDRSALIFGGGPVGVAHIFVLRVVGCKQILVSQSSTARAPQNRKFADAVFDSATEAVGERCCELTGGEGVDVVFDCAGNHAGLDVGMYFLRFKVNFATVSPWIGTPVSIRPYLLC
jgi:threonine dehydrogenase-like Zn-dependent dehydrogenase